MTQVLSSSMPSLEKTSRPRAISHLPGKYAKIRATNSCFNTCIRPSFYIKYIAVIVPLARIFMEALAWKSVNLIIAEPVSIARVITFWLRLTVSKF